MCKNNAWIYAWISSEHVVRGSHVACCVTKCVVRNCPLQRCLCLNLASGRATRSALFLKNVWELHWPLMYKFSAEEVTAGRSVDNLIISYPNKVRTCWAESFAQWCKIQPPTDSIDAGGCHLSAWFPTSMEPQGNPSCKVKRQWAFATSLLACWNLAVNLWAGDCLPCRLAPAVWYYSSGLLRGVDIPLRERELAASFSRYTDSWQCGSFLFYNSCLEETLMNLRSGSREFRYKCQQCEFAFGLTINVYMEEFVSCQS